MQELEALSPSKATPPEEFFRNETTANLATVTMTSFDKDTVLLNCEGDFTIELGPEAAKSISSKASLFFPSTKTEHIAYQVQPLADRTDIVIRWSQAQASNFGGLGLGILSAWEERQEATGKDEPANVVDTPPDTP